MFNKKILCLGANNKDTDDKTTILADTNQTTNHGLVLDENFNPELPGYYHTSIVDISFGGIIKLAKQFDTILSLDQTADQWPHEKPILSTFKLMAELEKLGYDTVYQSRPDTEKYKTFHKLLEENKSFCIYPWIEKIEGDEGYLTPCARSSKKITTNHELKDWRTDQNYQKIRQSMLKGELLPDTCSYCYDYENKGIESYRIYETKEWTNKLKINSIEDLEKIDRPYYYEVRLNNKCNVQCRSCRPEHSHLIEKEYKKFNIIYPPGLIGRQDITYSSTDIIDINTLDTNSRVYLTGGEPTIISEVYRFMEKCITANKTDFHFTLGTNGQKISDKFIELADHFSDMNFSFSLDCYGKINDYWRWGSNWDTVIKNAHLLESKGHSISINTVPGIYSVTNLHLLFEFLDREFPMISVYIQLNSIGIQSAYNHPNYKLVLESMEKCKKTNVYYADGKSCKTGIDSLFDYYSTGPECNWDDLKKFFDYNDQLDRARNVKLADYIPELEACRNLIPKY
jgi:pyruvate-formate lyase-activating enzyme